MAEYLKSLNDNMLEAYRFLEEYSIKNKSEEQNLNLPYDRIYEHYFESLSKDQKPLTLNEFEFVCVFELNYKKLEDNTSHFKFYLFDKLSKIYKELEAEDPYESSWLSYLEYAMPDKLLKENVQFDLKNKQEIKQNNKLNY